VSIVGDEMKCDDMKERERKYKKETFCCKVEYENEGRKVEQRMQMMRKKQQVRQKGDLEGKQRRLMKTERCRRGSYKKYNAVSLVVRCSGRPADEVM